MSQKKIIGIDYGSKRVGVAISDEGNAFGLPLTVVSTKEALEEIKKHAKAHDVNEIVIGESRNYKGEANTILAESLKFKKELESCGFKVHLEPEFMTSAHVEKLQGKTEMTDASAAALILQSYLDRRKNQEP